MSYQIYTGADRDIGARLNGALPLGPVPYQGLPVGGLTLAFLTPVQTVTFSGSAGATRSIQQIVQDLAAVSGLAVDVAPADSGLYWLYLRRDAGLSLGSSGTANALFALSTTQSTSSAGAVTATDIVGYTQGATAGQYALLLKGV